MPYSKSVRIALLLTTVLGQCALSWAQPQVPDAKVTAAQGELARGEVRKIDKEARKITIKHGEIKRLDMPPMTMVFTIRDPAWLEKLKPGDQIQFDVAREDGKMVVTEIQLSK